MKIHFKSYQSKLRKMKVEIEGQALPNTLNFIVSAVVHLLLVLPVLYIIGIFSINYSFFSWHPICMAAGVGLLILEGVFSISGEANLGHRLTRVKRVTAHWIINTVGLILVFIGLIVIVVNKNMSGREHFHTTHGKLGLASIIIACGVTIVGIVANNTRWVYPTFRPVIVKAAHAVGGIFMTVLFIATTINGVYKMKSFGETGKDLVCAAFVIATILILVKPIILVVGRTKSLIKPAQQHNQST